MLVNKNEPRFLAAKMPSQSPKPCSQTVQFKDDNYQLGLHYWDHLPGFTEYVHTECQHSQLLAEYRLLPGLAIEI